MDFTANVLYLQGKGRKTRIIDIHPELLPELVRWRRAQREAATTAELRALNIKDTAHVLLTRTGKPLNASAPWKALVRRAARAGVRPLAVGKDKRGRTKDNQSEVKCHMLRATFATRVLEAGQPIDAVADLLGHADVQTTRLHYTNPSDARRRNSVLAFSVDDERTER